MGKFNAYTQIVGRSRLTDINLTGPNSQLSILPSCGFKMYSAIYKGRQIIMTTPDITEPGAGNGVPILFPFPNRTRDCKYSFGGHDCTVKKDGKEMFLHGLLVHENFEFEIGCDDEKAWAKGWHHITKDSEFFDSYPFPCTLTLTYTLSAKGLELKYEVTNDGIETLPYGFAIHPYFTKFGAPDDVTIQVPATHYYEAEQQMPTGKLIPAEGEFDISYARPVGSVAFDHVFHGLNSEKEAVIGYKSQGFSMGLRASDDMVNMVVYTPGFLPGFCLENQTNATDYINLYNQGIESACMQTVDPGQTKSGWIFARMF